MWQLPRLLFTQAKEAEVTAFGQCCGTGTHVSVPFATNNPTFLWESPLMQFSPESYILAPSLILHYPQKGNKRKLHRELKWDRLKASSPQYFKEMWWEGIGKSEVQIGQNGDLGTGFPIHGEWTNREQWGIMGLQSSTDVSCTTPNPLGLSGSSYWSRLHWRVEAFRVPLKRRPEPRFVSLWICQNLNV